MLNLHKDGESFLHPQFIDMVRYAKKKNVAKMIHLNTNALLWEDKIIDGILDSGIDDITVSFDASRAETYIRDKGFDFLARAERNVVKLLNERNKHGLSRPFIRAKIMEFDNITHGEINEFFKKWTGVADSVQVTGIHNWSGKIKGLRVTDEFSRVRYPCVIMWYSLVINWNGEVTVCSVDWNTEINVGNANKNTLHEIWNSSEIKIARKSQIDKDYSSYGVCKDCVVWVSIGNMTEWLIKQKKFYT